MAKTSRQLELCRCKAAAGQPLSPARRDARFAGDAWTQWPFNVYAHSYRNYVDWWQQGVVERAGRRRPRMSAP